MNLSVASIVTSDYISEGYTLSESIRLINPSVQVYLLVIGELSHQATELAPTNVKIVKYEDVVEKRTALVLQDKYTPFELCCAIRGIFHLWLFENSKTEKWLMLDSDMYVFSSLMPISNYLDKNDIILTLHSNKPVAIEEAIPHEVGILNHGLYNGGFFGAKRTKNTLKILEWMSSRLIEYGYSGFLKNSKYQQLKLFVDQLWLNFIPIYFNNVHISDDEVLNLGHWNLHQGELRNINGKYYFRDEQVVIAHFSSVPINNPEYVSNHSSLYIKKPVYQWKNMFNSYISTKEKYMDIKNKDNSYMHYIKKIIGALK